jgi:hypothetical protein
VDLRLQVRWLDLLYRSLTLEGYNDLNNCFLFAFPVLSMVLTVSILVDVASLWVLALAPYAVYQKHQLAELGGMRGQQNALRQVRILL